MVPYHPDEIALYRSILEAPHDDAPRLIYADWQDEFGDPEFAAFIRLQIAKYADDPNRSLITDEEHDLLFGGVGTGRGNRWFRPVHVPVIVERGFPTAAVFPAVTECMRVAVSVVENHPVCRVTVKDRVPEPVENGRLVRWNYRSDRFPESVIPGTILSIMDRDWSTGTGAGRVPVVFGSLAQADAALSLAVVNAARDRVNMSPLTKEDVDEPVPSR